MRLAARGPRPVNYTFSRNKADATYDNAAIDDPQNPLDKDAEFAAALTDRTHLFTASYVYELPFAAGSDTGWRRALLGGWQVAGITRIESGPAARVQVSQLQLRRLVFPGALRPNQVGNPAAGDQNGLLWVDPRRLSHRPRVSMARRPLRRSACPAVTSGTSPCRKT